MNSHGAYDPVLVGLSIAVAIFASFTGLSLAGRLRAADPAARGYWLAMAALAIGGGIWSMHFIGMLAVTAPHAATYDIGLTLLSFVLPVLVTGASLWVVSRFGCAGRALLGAGLFMGFGIAAMHYLGIAAMRMPAARIAYDAPLVAASIGIAVGAATAALWVAFRARRTRERLAAAVLMGLAIAGMHYTGMAAVSYTATGVSHWHSQAGPSLLPVAVATSTGFLLLLALLSAYFDRKLATLSAREANALRRSEERFRALIRNTSDVIAVLSPEGAFLFASPSAEQMLGYSPEAIVGRRLADLAAPAAAGQADGADAFLAAVAAADGALATGCLRLRHAEDGWRDIEAVGSDARTQPGVGGIVVTLRDVTAARQHEVQLRAAKEQAEVASRAKSVFLASMSHELRTPLNAIIGFADIMQAELFGPHSSPKYREYAADIRKSGSVLLALINDVLDLSKIEAGQMRLEETTIDVRGLIREAMRMLEPRAANFGVSLGVHVAADVRACRVDSLRLKQVLLNLLSNAIKFTPRGGTAQVVASRDADGRIVLAVSDTGIGIAPTDLARLFVPFTQLGDPRSRPSEGAGLGLVIARQIVEMHGGSLALASEPGKGTTATVTLPAVRVVGGSAGIAA